MDGGKKGNVDGCIGVAFVVAGRNVLLCWELNGCDMALRDIASLVVGVVGIRIVHRMNSKNNDGGGGWSSFQIGRAHV